MKPQYNQQDLVHLVTYQNLLHPMNFFTKLNRELFTLSAAEAIRSASFACPHRHGSGLAPSAELRSSFARSSCAPICRALSGGSCSSATSLSFQSVLTNSPPPAGGWLAQGRRGTRPGCPSRVRCRRSALPRAVAGSIPHHPPATLL